MLRHQFGFKDVSGIKLLLSLICDYCAFFLSGWHETKSVDDAYEIAIKFNDGFHWRSMTSN